MEPIAIIGTGCRFPGASNPEAFWQLLSRGESGICEIPAERWDIESFYDPEPSIPEKMNTRYGGFLEQVDQFDPTFFGITPKEIKYVDPHQRLILEVAWEALENAAIIPKTLAGSASSVFIGIGNYDFGALVGQDLSNVSAHAGTGFTLGIAANRLSYLLDLRGPSLTLETACSSSLVALHYACRSLQAGESNLSIVGAVNVLLHPGQTIAYSQARMMAPDGQCKTFDAGADGYVRGEGCGVVILKRLNDAIRDGDPIQAVIRGSAVNQDGRSNGLTAPNVKAQRAVIGQALENAEVSPEDISYLEAHGTGTFLGDPIEVKSLKAVLMKERSSEQPCWLGSVKTNIGHLEAAAGMAGLIKVILSLQHQQIPPHRNFKQLNPYISLKGTTFNIPTTLQPWTTHEKKRLAGISSFGFGGTNAHVIVEEAPPQTPVENHQERPLHLFTLSAKKETALQQQARNYLTFLEKTQDASLEDICFTANTGRSPFNHRLAVAVRTCDQLYQQLKGFVEGSPSPEMLMSYTKGQTESIIVFLFTGQGSQYLQMGRQLYQTQKTFKSTLDACAEILDSYLDQPLLSVLYAEDDDETLHQTAYTQPILFSIEYALCKMWQAWGIEPAAVMGHSVGEYVAACVAGVFSLQDGLTLIAQRGKLMQSLPQSGAMLAVQADEATVRKAIQPYHQSLAIAAINGPTNLVISGEKEGVDAVRLVLETAGIKTKPLQVSHGFHSPLMEPILRSFAQVANGVTYKTPKIPFISNLTGTVTTHEVTTPQYWCEHIRQPVQFMKGMATLEAEGYKTFLEVGPKPILSSMGRLCLTDNPDDYCFVPSLRPGTDEWQQILLGLGTLYSQGISVNWSGFDQDYNRRRISLPTYPFQRRRYWLESLSGGYSSQKSSAPNSESTPLLSLLHQGKIEEIIESFQQEGGLSGTEEKLLPTLLQRLLKQPQAPLGQQGNRHQDWFYEIDWQLQSPGEASAAQANSPSPENWLIFADQQGTGAALAHQLKAQGHHCRLVYVGEEYHIDDNGHHYLNPANMSDFIRLFRSDDILNGTPLKGIIHLWSLDTVSAEDLNAHSLKQGQMLGCSSVLHLIQVLASGSQPQKPKLWLATQGAVAINQELPQVMQTPLWGMGKAIALEQPDLWGGMIDLGGQTTSSAATTLWSEIQNNSGENQVAWRGQERYVPRLIRSDISASQDQPYSLRPDGTYLITGGLGSLGLALAQWLGEQGAQRLVLVSRHGPSTHKQALAINQLQKQGVDVVIERADITQSEQVMGLFQNVQTPSAPLRGIIHAAGVLNDGILLQQSWYRFAQVMEPKIQGTWNLHQWSQTLELDFFVCFSSIAALFGSPGQSNYAAGNAFMDSLCHYRRRKGLKGISINWGPWHNQGMAAGQNHRHQSQGINAIDLKSGWQALQRLWQCEKAQVGVVPIDWPKLAQALKAQRSIPHLFYEQLQQEGLWSVVESASEANQTFLEQYHQASESDRVILALDYVKSTIARVMRIPASELSTDQCLSEMGFDSLMAVELGGILRHEIQVDIPIRSFVENPSIASLGNFLVDRLSPGSLQPSSEKGEGLDLEAEVVLDETIHPSTTYQPSSLDSPKSVFITGATGFLGAFLLQELLKQTSANIYCLVRSSTLEMAQTKLHQNLQNYGIWQERYQDRIIAVLGDLGKPKFGLTDTDFGKLAQVIDVIYHNGAMLNYIFPYAKFKPTNVLGTQEVLRLACDHHTKPVHYISTVGVFESSEYYGKQVTESDPVHHSRGIYLGYSQSKWVSEKLVVLAQRRRLPVSIYRPPLISGHSQSGVWKTDDFNCRMIKGCIQLQAVPDLDCLLDLSPIDYVSRGIIYLSQQTTSLGQAFHLQNPQPLHLSDFGKILDEYGYPIEQIPYEEWCDRISGHRDNPLFPLLPYFTTRWSDTNLTYLELAQQSIRPRIACQQTVESLRGSSIGCPALDQELLRVYLSYLNQVGYIDSPQNSPILQ